LNPPLSPLVIAQFCYVLTKLVAVSVVTVYSSARRSLSSFTHTPAQSHPRPSTVLSGWRRFSTPLQLRA